MKARTLIFILIALLYSIVLSAQQQTSSAKFYVIMAYENGRDISRWATSTELYTVFYIVDDELYMANVCPEQNSQSYGPIYNMKSKSYPATATEYERVEFRFNWAYKNTYDNKKGICRVKFSKSYGDDGSTYSLLDMTTEDHRNIKYYGYMENYFDLSKYGNKEYSHYDDGDNYFIPRETYTYGSGTCFALSSNGYLATCYHLIEGASTIQIKGINGNFDKKYTAKVVSYDRNNDLAILKIDDNNFTTLGNVPYSISSKTTDVGENCYVLGYPLRADMGDEIKLTNGLISSKSGFQGDITSYQISAPSQPGNSGGPLFDKNGNLIGIVNAKLTIAESASYAVKSPYLKTLMSAIDDNIPPTTNILSGKSLAEQVKEIKKFIYIIEVQ